MAMSDLELYLPDVLGPDGGELHGAALPHRGQGRVPGQVADVTEHVDDDLISHSPHISQYLQV